MIRPIAPSDIAPCLDIYNHYIRYTTVSFEEVPLTLPQFSRRVETITENFPWLVLEEDGAITGFAYLSPFHERSAFRISCDLSIYLRFDLRRGGRGKALYGAIEEKAKELGFVNIVSVVTSENLPSVRFHLHQGFREVGLLPDIAVKFGRSLGVYYLLKKL